MVLATAKTHFDQDIARASALIAHASGLPRGLVGEDVWRAAWMMGVGACDAYFSDAYADLISRALRAKELQPAIAIPDRLNKLKIPVTAILRTSATGWRWRMAARELIEGENVLSLEKIRTLFHHFFRKSFRPLSSEGIEPWIVHPDSRVRLFGVTAAAYRRVQSAHKSATKKEALDRLEERFEVIFQRRHDCIHNCDRPKAALQSIEPQHVSKAIEDITFLVTRFHEALIVEFPVYLRELKFSGATRNQVCG